MQRHFVRRRWHRKKIRTTNLRRVTVVALFCAFIGQLVAGDKIKIDVRQSDESIRQKLLQLTQPGTPTQKVFELAQSRLQRESPVVGWPPKEPKERFGNFIWTRLGHYREPLGIFPIVVQAFWYFDQHDKLRDIRVRRVVSGL